MAQKVQVFLIDDIDGTTAVETVTFSLDGVTYEIDLNEDHSAKLRQEIGSWAKHARRAGGRKLRGKGGSGAGSSSKTAAIRSWARENGFDVSGRGRVSAEIRDAYAAAH